MDDDEKQWIKDVFKGNLKERDEYCSQVTREFVYWDDIKLSCKVYPELEEYTKRLIEKRLGYLPHPNVTIPFEPYLRALYQYFRSGQITETDFYTQADEHIKLIRNKDMEPNLCLEYDPLIYENYWKTYLPYGQMAKERLIRFLGYEPDLEHSLVAEMWLRKFLAINSLKLPDTITIADYKAITLIKYRQVLLSVGESFANDMPLLL